MQSLYGSIEPLTAEVPSAVDVRRIVIDSSTAHRFERPRDLFKRTAMVANTAVDIEDQVAQAGALEAYSHSFDGGALLGDEQDGLSLRGECGDQVSDGLRFAGARRSDDHQVAPGDCGVDGGGLRCVRVEDEELILR